MSILCDCYNEASIRLRLANRTRPDNQRRLFLFKHSRSFNDFANRYPNDPDRDYALLMVGHTYSARKLRPDRDLSDIHEALAAYEQLINLYPNSGYMPEAESRVNGLNELLAEHDWIVGQFYFRNKRLEGALWRFENIRDNYPNFSKIDSVNVKISDLETLIEERDAAWKKRLEELKKKTGDKTED